jgi:hypothetical protein
MLAGQGGEQLADQLGGHRLAVDLARGVAAEQGADRGHHGEQHLHRRQRGLPGPQHQVQQAVDHLLPAAALIGRIAGQGVGVGGQRPVQRPGLGQRADHADRGHPLGPFRAQIHPALAQRPRQPAGGLPGVAGGDEPAGLVAQLRRGAHRAPVGPAGDPGQQLGLHRRAQRVVGDRRDLVQQMPQVPGVQQPGLQPGQRARQPVHQGQRPLQQRLGGLRGEVQRDRQLGGGPLADRAQRLGAGGPAVGAHRARLARSPVGRRRPGRGERRHRPGPHRGLPGDLPVRGLHRPQRPRRPPHRRE